MGHAANSSSSRRGFRAILCWILAIVLAVYVVSAGCSSGGCGQFSPDTLQIRTQSEILLPSTRVPIYRSFSDYHTLPVVAYLTDHAYWSPRDVSDPRWIPVFRWNQRWNDGEGPLYRELAWRSDEWIEWTKSNPEKAWVLWPRVLSALRSEPAKCRLAELLLLQAQGPESAEALEKLAAEFETMPYP